MSTSKRATPEFVANFEIVANHYQCTPSEITEMKQLARSNMEAATESFGLMAREVLGMVSAEGAA